MKKRILTLTLALVMCLSLIPVVASAAGETVIYTGGGYSMTENIISYDLRGHSYDIVSELAPTTYTAASYMNAAGNLVLSVPGYDQARGYSEGLAAVQKGGKWGFIDISGNLVIPCQFNGDGKFHNGVAVLYYYNSGTSTVDYTYSVIDKTGNVLIPEGEYCRILADGSGMLAASKESDSGGLLWGALDTSGNVVVEPIYQNVAVDVENTSGLLAVCKDGKWGFIDGTGAVVIPFEYGGSAAFNSFGYAPVWSSSLSKWGVIDANNDLIIPFDYDSVPGEYGYPFIFLSKNLVAISSYDGFDEAWEQFVMNLPDKSTNHAFDGYTMSWPFVSGYTTAWDYSQESYAILDAEGNIIIPAEILKDYAIGYNANSNYSSGNLGAGRFHARKSNEISANSYNCILKIETAAPSGPSVSTTSINVAVGATNNFTLSLGELGNRADSVSISSGNNRIATVSPATLAADGTVVVTGVSAGTTSLTLTFSGGDLQSPVVITVAVTVVPATYPSDPVNPGWEDTDAESYSQRTLTDSKNGISVKGDLSSDAKLSVKEASLHAENTCDACDEIRAQAAAGNVLILYDISVIGSYRGKLEIRIYVGTKYNGQVLTVLHCSGKTLESQDLLVVDGYVTGTFSNLSPFAVLESSLFSATEPPQTGSRNIGWIGLLMLNMSIVIAFIIIHHNIKTKHNRIN